MVKSVIVKTPNRKTIHQNTGQLKELVAGVLLKSQLAVGHYIYRVGGRCGWVAGSTNCAGAAIGSGSNRVGDCIPVNRYGIVGAGAGGVAVACIIEGTVRIHCGGHCTRNRQIANSNVISIDTGIGNVNGGAGKHSRCRQNHHTRQSNIEARKVVDMFAEYNRKVDRLTVCRVGPAQQPD